MSLLRPAQTCNCSQTSHTVDLFPHWCKGCFGEVCTPQQAEQRTRFFDRSRSYVINYNLGKDIVRRYVESRAGSGDSGKRWQEFVQLISSPRLPSSLR